MDKSKANDTLIVISCNMDRDEQGNSVEESRYQGMNESLIYLTPSRLDIIFFICLSSRF